MNTDSLATARAVIVNQVAGKKDGAAACAGLYAWPEPLIEFPGNLMWGGTETADVQ